MMDRENPGVKSYPYDLDGNIGNALRQQPIYRYLL
jgi:hypothetical protein